MFPAILALLLMGALLLAWPMSRAAAAPDSPVFETSETNTVDATSITIGKPAGTVVDDLLIAAVNHGVTISFLDNVTITPPSGWTQIDHGQCDNNQCVECVLGVWYKLAGGSEPSDYTFTLSEFIELAPGAINMAAGGIPRYSNVDPVDPINASGADTGTTSSPTTPNVTTTVVDTMVLRIAGVDDD